MHILHHVVPGIQKYGPVYGTWMYSFERFNSWMCRSEATVLETYRVSFCDIDVHSLAHSYAR